MLGVPIIEIVVAAVVAHAVGWLVTLLVLIALSGLGLWQIKVQGFAAWRQASRQIALGEAPGFAILDGALRVLGAALLVLPGFCSAFVGLALLVGSSRNVIAKKSGAWLVSRFSEPLFVVSNGRFGSGHGDGIVDVDGWEDSTGSGRPGDHPMLGRPGS